MMVPIVVHEYAHDPVRLPDGARAVKRRGRQRTRIGRHMRRRLLALGLGCVVGVASCGPHDTDQPHEPQLVLAAVSLSEALKDAGTAYTGETGTFVRFNFAASNVLARQVREGAAADVFVSADEHQIDGLERDGLIDGVTRVALLKNELAVVVREGWSGRLTDARDLVSPGVRRIAVGDPSGVPAGVYAREYLARTGLWEPLASRLVPSVSVRAALAAVDEGHADAAIVYSTDVRIATRARLAFVISGPHAPRIVYPAAVLARSRQPAAARKLLRWLHGPAAAAIFRRHGFVPLSDS